MNNYLFQSIGSHSVLRQLVFHFFSFFFSVQTKGLIQALAGLRQSFPCLQPGVSPPHPTPETMCFPEIRTDTCKAEISEASFPLHHYPLTNITPYLVPFSQHPRGQPDTITQGSQCEKVAISSE